MRAHIYRIGVMIKEIVDEYELKGAVIDVSKKENRYLATIKWDVVGDDDILGRILDVPFPCNMSEIGWENFERWQLGNIREVFDEIIERVGKLQ